jgi:serine/threonine protein phosphatase PrpC
MDNHPRGTNPHRTTAAKRASSSVSPFTFASHSIAHERHPERNEDTILVDRGRGLASVFDGVGGVSAGEIASQLAARVTRQAWRHTLQQQQPQNSSDLLMLHDDLDIQVLVHQLLEEAQSAISDEGDRRVKAAATTPGQVTYPETTAAVAVLCLCLLIYFQQWQAICARRVFAASGHVTPLG